MNKFKTIRDKRKIQNPPIKQKWKLQKKFYHNKASHHFFLGIAKRGVTLAGHDMTTHPSLTSSGRPKKKYLILHDNPNPNDKRKSYLDRKLRKNVKVCFDDSGKKRLTIKKGWKLSKKDIKAIKKIDKKQIKNPHNSV